MNDYTIYFDDLYMTETESTTARIRPQTEKRLDAIKLVEFVDGEGSHDCAINAAIDYWERHNPSTDELLEAMKENDDVEVHRTVCGETLVETVDDDN